MLQVKYMNEVRNSHGFPEIPIVTNKRTLQGCTRIRTVEELKRYLEFVPNNWALDPIIVSIDFHRYNKTATVCIQPNV